MSVQQEVQLRLENVFTPEYLQIDNESHQHHVPPGSESHFKVVIVSDQFEGKKLLARHRMVNECLSDLLAEQIHALALHTYTREQWGNLSQIPQTPNCRGINK